MTDRAAKLAGKIFSVFRVRSGMPALAAVLLLALTPLSVTAGLDVMTNHELGELEGGRLIELAMADNFYGSTPAVTVCRFASDIYLEAYGEIGALKVGNYPRSVSELGDMASMDSNYTMVYGPMDRTNPPTGHLYRTYAGADAVDNPYGNNTNRTDRIHDRYMGANTTTIGLGQAAYLNVTTAPWDNFGSNLCSNYPETQWDINWERMRTGVSAEFPLRIYGLILRAEFDNWGTSRQMLRRFVVGSNKLYGYSSARPLVTSGWLNAEMSRLNNAVMPLMKQTVFQLQRDPLMDQYWQLSSFNFNPNNDGDQGSFRQFWFNTCMNDVTTSAATLPANFVGRFQDKNHGFFLLVDMTDKRFSGWNLVGGVNEYKNWPPLEQNDDYYFEEDYISPAVDY